MALSGRAQRSAAASGITLQLRDVTRGLFQTLTQTSKLSPPRLLWTAQPSRPGWSPAPPAFARLGQRLKQTQTSETNPDKQALSTKPGHWSPAPGLPKRPGVCAWSAVLRPSTQHEKIAAPQHAVPSMPLPAASPHSNPPLRPVRAYHRPAHFSSPGACALQPPCAPARNLTNGLSYKNGAVSRIQHPALILLRTQPPDRHPSAPDALKPTITFCPPGTIFDVRAPLSTSATLGFCCGTTKPHPAQLRPAKPRQHPTLPSSVPAHASRRCRAAVMAETSRGLPGAT